MDQPWEIDLTVYDSEAALLEGLRRRDRHACTCVLKWFMPRLYQLALRMTGNSDEAEDVVQEGFIKACAQIDRFEERSGLGSWLYRIVLNTALMHLRKQKAGDRHRAPPATGDTAPAVELVPDETGDPGAQLLAGELRAQIDAAIQDLPPALRAAFVLRDLEGLSTAEAAQALGISEAALKVRLHRARLALRAALAGYLTAPSTSGADPAGAGQGRESAAKGGSA
jgi:RNA polymerase sigma-70 factor (ECF subfamily)